jgi:hypothetical protein
MLTLSPKLGSRLPVRLDISWMTGGSAHNDTPAADLPHNAVILSQILELNPTASPEFLSQFSDGALHDYLDHLQDAASPRGRFSRRVRPDNTPGVTWRTAQE